MVMVVVVVERNFKVISDRLHICRSCISVRSS
jgi:hypothetical protein